MKLLARITGLLYFALLINIFFFGNNRPHATLLLYKSRLNLIPVKDKVDFFYLNNVPFFGKYEFYTNLFGNILLFIPIPLFLVSFFFIDKPWKTVLIAFAISLCVETTQFILSIGFADIDDVILNTTGAVIGVAGLKLLKKKLPIVYSSTVQ